MRTSLQRPQVWMALALIICLPAGAQAQRQVSTITFEWPPVPTVEVPTVPFVKNAAAMRKLNEYWGIIEEHKDEIERPTYERLRLSVERAQDGIGTVERNARGHVRLCRQFESELKILLGRVAQFHRRLDAHSGRKYKDRAAFERAAAPFRSQHAALRKRWENLATRAKRLNRKLQNDLKPERERAERAVARVVGELAEVVERLRKYPAIGAAGAVSGNVTATHPWGGDPVRLSSGMVVYLQDDVSTGPAGRMQVLLLDETVFTVGPDTELTLDEFVYDAFTETGRIIASITQGLIKFVSGKVAAKTPKNMKIKTPVGSLGRRGTDFIVAVGNDGRTRIDVLEGRVEFTSDRDGSSVLIREGEQLRVGADGAIGKKTEIDVEQVEREWEAASGFEAPPDGDSSRVQREAAPFELVHYVIIVVALVIVAVALWKMSLWEIPPMLALVLPFVLCIKATGRISHEGWWWWWGGCAAAGYIVFRVLVLLVIAIVEGLTGILRRIWPVLIGLGVIATAAGLLFVFEHGQRIVRFIYVFVFTRSYLEPGVYDEVQMFVSWAFTGLGLLVAIGGFWTVISALGQRPRESDNYGWTPLHTAAFRDQKETAMLLLVRGANVNARESHGSTPLHLAASEGHKDGGHKEMAELLLANGADVNAKNSDGMTPLHTAARRGHAEVAGLLLAGGADVNAANDCGATPLHEVAERGQGGRRGRREVTELLLAKGADVDAKKKDGRTPLDIAIAMSHEVVAGLLLAGKAGVEPPERVQTRVKAPGNRSSGLVTKTRPCEICGRIVPSGTQLISVSDMRGPAANGFAEVLVKGNLSREKRREKFDRLVSSRKKPFALCGNCRRKARTFGEDVGSGSTEETERGTSGQKLPERSLEGYDDEFKEAEDDMVDVGPEEEPRCPVCGDGFAGGRTSRCAQCGRSVHRASCLSRVTVAGGRLCKKCCTEEARAVSGPDRAEAPSQESLILCPDCGAEAGNEDRYCRSCGRSLSSSVAPAAAESRSGAPRPAPTSHSEPGHDLNSAPPVVPRRPSGYAACNGCDRHFNILPAAEAQDVKYVDMLKGMAIPFWCPDCDDLICTECMAREQGVELDGPVMLSKTCGKCGGSRELLPTGELAKLQEEVEREDSEADEAAGLTEQQRSIEIGMAVDRLVKLGGAAAHQRALANQKAYEHIGPQIVKIGERLRELGGIPLVDAVYSRFEEAAARSAVREVTMAWRSGLSGWTM